jgi:hypothetical protein
MHKAFVGFLIIFGFFFLFEGQTQAAGDGEGVSGYRLAAQDGRDYESLYKGLGTKGGSNDPGTRDVGDSNVPSDSRIDSSVSGKELTPAQWAAVLGLMTLNFWLAKRRGRNAWRWFFGTLVLNVFATIYLLVTKPLPGASAASGMVDQDLLRELKAIKGVGGSTADKVAAKFSTRAALSQASRSQLEAIHGVGEKQASLIRAHFH